MTDIYGIDPDGEVTPIDVRNALIECFTLAHGELLAYSLNIDISQDADDDIKRESIITLLKGIFDKNDVDFDNPTKVGLKKIISRLKEFSKNFRDPNVVKKHAEEIMILINKLL